MFWVYVLRNPENKRLYVGSTSDLNRRLQEHHRKSKKGYILIYREECRDKAQALKRELYFKTGNGRRALKSLINA